MHRIDSIPFLLIKLLLYGNPHHTSSVVRTRLIMLLLLLLLLVLLLLLLGTLLNHTAVSIDVIYFDQSLLTITAAVIIIKRKE